MFQVALVEDSGSWTLTNEGCSFRCKNLLLQAPGFPPLPGAPSVPACCSLKILCKNIMNVPGSKMWGLQLIGDLIWPKGVLDSFMHWENILGLKEFWDKLKIAPIITHLWGVRRMSYKKCPEMVHSVKCMPSKHENLILVTRTRLKKHVDSASTGEAKPWDMCNPGKYMGLTWLYSRSSTNPDCVSQFPLCSHWHILSLREYTDPHPVMINTINLVGSRLT